MTRVVDVVRAVIAPLTRTRVFRRVIGPTLLPPLEHLLARITHGRVQLSALLVPSLVLHTVGAKSGVARDVPLMYTPDGQGRAIVAGTNFAGERHPAWTTNLLANPDADITVRGRRMRVRATLIPGAERDATWATIERQWPGYRNYEREPGRTVRLFRLQPVRPPD
ncbi:nitroreductase family deazaflavin-dependent oxidoreductase [Microbacterium sp. CPCC 204701]|uniref:nitroreductase family deazaflavin-dependent oxidoreductase n=1 Tax=Microbacterium sp. CPCC 204701 TaxID=2493084 RepID=UPI000FD711EF|nr:nitroreductase family deazaflavin-dependent oxidoreductase [Microbacterium sp. CPCC 204701]